MLLMFNVFVIVFNVYAVGYFMQSFIAMNAGRRTTWEIFHAPFLWPYFLVKWAIRKV